MPRAVEEPLLSSSSGSDASEGDSNDDPPSAFAGGAAEEKKEQFRLKAVYWWRLPVCAALLSVIIFMYIRDPDDDLERDDFMGAWVALFIVVCLPMLVLVPKLCASKLTVSSTGLTYTKPSTGISCFWSSMTVEWTDVASISCKSVSMTNNCMACCACLINCCKCVDDNMASRSDAYGDDDVLRVDDLYNDREGNLRSRRHQQQTYNNARPYVVDAVVIMLTPAARKEKSTYLSRYCMEQCGVDLAIWMFALGMTNEEFVNKLNALKAAQDSTYVPPAVESSDDDDDDDDDEAEEEEEEEEEEEGEEEEDIESGKAAGKSRCFKVVFSQGAVARAGVKMDSEKRGVLAKGATIKAVAVRKITHNGKKVTRVQLEVRGCVSNCVVGRRD
jgi:hypothetical protein